VIASAKRLGSTLPPEATAMTSSARRSAPWNSAAASATAPPGSSTTLRWAKASDMARSASSSVTASPSPARLRRIGKVICPGRGVRIASQIEPVGRALLRQSPASSDWAMSSKPAGSTVRTEKSGASAESASAMPEASPPPPQQTSTSAARIPASAASCAISRPVVPCPAITSGWS
jgi:hypothetical protein